jgi:hypothetical protein
LIHPAATSQDEHDAITFQQSVNLNNSAPYARIIHLDRTPSPRPVTRLTYARNIYGFGRDRESYGLISGRTVLRYPHLKEVL